MIARFLATGTTGALALTAALVTTSAHAQDRGFDPLGGRTRNVESPQHFAAEIRFSPFKPDVDSDPALGGRAPYATAFGTGPNLLVSAEFDWQALRIPDVGTLGPGLGAGYSTASGRAPYTAPRTGLSPEQTTLDMFPFYAVAVFRADVLWRQLHVPLVPYVKAGIAFSLWRASNTLGTSHYQGISGTGSSLGTQLALGLGLNLNVFDPYAAKNFDEAMGVNGTYLFAELDRSDLTGLGLQKDPLRVGGTSWNFGLAFEF